MIAVDLPWPAKILWPNGRTRSVHGRARLVKHHRAWGDGAVLAALKGTRPTFAPDQRFAIKITVHAKPTGPLPDADNCVAAAKNYLDGIADRLGINDRQFAAPTVEFATPRDGRFIIEVTPL